MRPGSRTAKSSLRSSSIAAPAMCVGRGGTQLTAARRVTTPGAAATGTFAPRKWKPVWTPRATGPGMCSHRQSAGRPPTPGLAS
eukprot:722928-Heterocapsa_arctica.AAC.1